MKKYLYISTLVLLLSCWTNTDIDSDIKNDSNIKGSSHKTEEYGVSSMNTVEVTVDEQEELSN
jgi:acyl carrier protein